MSTRSGGSFRSVIQARVRPGKRVRIKNAKLPPEVGFVHVRVARLPDSPLSLHFGCAGAHVKLFGRVVWGCPCQLVRAGRSSEGAPG